ncbi:MAG: motility protein A [Phycisphaerae bacterium]|nr:motility protein A [Phycisphaerae bacterium]
MDKSSIIGITLGVVCVSFVCWRASEGHLAMFYSEKGLIMVLGGTISVLFMAMPLSKLRQVPGYVKRFMFDRRMSLEQTVSTMNTLSEKARREGILSLESDLDTIDDSFLKQGVRMVVDGTDEEMVETTLRMEIVAMQERHRSGKKFFDLIKLYAPGYGLVATLIGQIGMFGNLGGDIETLGNLLAIAVIATMYGALLANGIAGPMGDKLSMRSNEELMGKEMMLQGILSIQTGENPRATQERMLAFVPQASRQNFIKKAA